MDAMYDDPAFKEALRQARERAAAVNRARSQGGAPDPPESGTQTNSSKAKAKERRGLMSQPTAASARQAHVEQPTPPQPSRVPGAAAADRAGAAAAAEPGSPSAAAMYHHMPIPGQLGGVPPVHSPSTGPTLMQQMHMNELHHRMAMQNQHERALLGARLSGWGHQPGMLDPSADARWRAAQGLPPLSSAFAGGRGMLHATHPLGSRGPLLGGHPGPAGAISEAARSPMEAATARAAAADPEETGKPKEAGNALFDLLATAAEDTLRREEQKKSTAEEDEMEVENEKPASKGKKSAKGDKKKGASTTAAGSNSKQNAKRKRKAANEPKNPLGAFVFYQRKIMSDVFEENPLITFGEAAAECGKRWRELPDEEKLEYKQMAAEDKARYTRELATFKNKIYDAVPEPPEATPPPKETKPKGRRKKAPVDDQEPSQPQQPKRARSAFQFYKAEEIKKVFEEYPHVSTGEASTECSARYKALTKTQKQKWETMAKEDKVRFKNEFGGVIAPKKSIRQAAVKARISANDGAGTTGLDDKIKPDEEVKATTNDVAPVAMPVEAKVKYEDMVDPNPCYVEESAWRYHNPPLPPSRDAAPEEEKERHFPYVSNEELRPLPPPPPPPSDFPNTGYCKWSYDEDTRVLLANFRREHGGAVVTVEDEKYLLEMFERDDITVVYEGLLDGIDKDKWTLDYLNRVSGDEFYHRFRRFDKEQPENAPLKPSKKPTPPKEADSDEMVEAEKFVGVSHAEVDKCLSMKVADFVAYLRKRGAALAKLGDAASSEDKEDLCRFSFKDHNDEEHTIDVAETVLYMLDYDMVKLIPTLYEDFLSCFKLRSALPGGQHCMMNCVTPNGRPFMGPNLYITPPGSFTHFHQDGHGTVDSGHYCLSGYNEVIMTRRMTERSKRNALRFLTGSYKRNDLNFEGLYDLPHADLLGEKPKWPDNEAVAKCNEMNYCVSRFILKEGQCVHIGKGKLHAFRKVSNEALPPDDCHAQLRANLKIPGTNENVVGPGKPEVLCISVAWDWMYRGVTAKGINREIISIIECAALNRKYGAMSLAIPELSLIKMARTLAPKPDENMPHPGAYRESLVGFNYFYDKTKTEERKGYVPDPTVVCKGIFPALQYVVKQHINAINVAESLKSKSFERCKRVSVAKKPNAWENPVTHPLDPYGNSDFFCKLCNKELSNVYLHCDGCELLLSKDFNICIECHQEKRYAQSVQMHPLNNKRHSTINHIGNMTLDRASRCPCKNGPVCRHCNYCAGCSCRCHTWFTLYYRFFKKEEELALLHRVKRQVGKEDIEAAEEAEKRLTMAIKGHFTDGSDQGPFGLHCMDVLVDSRLQAVVATEDPEGELSHDESAEEPDPPAPVRKSRRVLEASPGPKAKVAPEETEKAEDDETESEEVESEKAEDDGTEKAEQGGTEDNGDMQIDVQDMKVTIRCQPGTLSSEHGIEQKKDASDTDEVVEEGADSTKCKVENTDEDATMEDAGDPSSVAADKDDGAEPSPSTTVAKETAVKNGDGAAQPSGPNTSVVKQEAAVNGDGEKPSHNTTIVKEEILDSTEAEAEPQPTENLEEADDEASERKVEGTKKGAPKPRTGRWTDEEKERLRIALTNESDWEGVERVVETRRFPAIRSYAPRAFPKLFEELRERMEKKGRRLSKSSKPIVKPQEPSAESEPTTTRRRSKRGSQLLNSPEGSKSDSPEPKEPAEARPEIAEVVAKPDPEAVVKKEKPSNDSDEEDSPSAKKPALRARKNPMWQRSQDLSGGRKRRNSATEPARQPDPPTESKAPETEPAAVETEPSAKRPKVEEGEE